MRLDHFGPNSIRDLIGVSLPSTYSQVFAAKSAIVWFGVNHCHSTLLEIAFRNLGYQIAAWIFDGNLVQDHSDNGRKPLRHNKGIHSLNILTKPALITS